MSEANKRIADAIHEFLKSPEGQKYIEESKERQQTWDLWNQYRNRPEPECHCGMCPKHGIRRLEVRD